MVKSILKKFRYEAVDQSWSAQAIERKEEDVELEQATQLLKENGKFATQMVLMQSMMTKKNLITYQLHEHLESAPTSFESLYSDICADGEGSLPFNCDLLDRQIEEACQEGEDAADADALESRRTGSGGLRFLQEHLRGVPDPSVAVASLDAQEDCEEEAGAGAAGACVPGVEEVLLQRKEVG